MMFVDKARNAVAVKVTETLTSIQSSVKMPSYAGDKNKDDSKYPTWTGQNGVNAVLDSVPSQGNRMEPVFAQYPELVPASTVVYPSTTVALTEVPNRAADPAIRYLFANELEQLAAGNAEPLAKRNPTALVFGLWDSRVTQTKVQRAVEATVVVRNAGHQPTASSLTTPFTKDERDSILTQTGIKGSEIGIDQVPVFNVCGALDVTSATIERTVTLSITALERFKSNSKLYDYLLGLALVAALSPIRFNLRAGTVLNRTARKIELFNDLQPVEGIDVNFDEVLAFARDAAKAFGVGKAETLTVDVEQIIAGAKQKSEKKNGKKKKGAASAA